MKKALILIVLISLFTPTRADVSSYYYFKQISLREGLPSSITAIYDDNEGFLWIGTIYGAYRFDGEKLKKYPQPDHLQGSYYIHNIQGDKWGNVWMFTKGGLSRYNPERDTFEFLLRNQRKIESYTLLSDGDHLIIPAPGKLLRYSKELEHITDIPIKDGHKQTVLIKIQKYDEQHYIATTTYNQMILIDRRTGEVKESPFGKQTHIQDFYADSKQRYWISVYGEGVSCYTRLGEFIATYNTHNSTLSHDVILDIEERKGLIWLATDGGGINMIDPETRQIKILSNTQNAQFPTNSVSCLHNGTNNMWIGMVREGILGAKENFITTYTKAPKNDPSGLSEKCPLCLWEDVDNKIWIGTDGGGVNCFDPQTEKFTHFPSTFGGKIVSICPYSANELLLSNFTKGIYIFNKKTGVCRRFLINDEATDSRINYSGNPVNLFIHRENEIEFHGGYFYRYNKTKREFTKMNVPGDSYGGSWIFMGEYNSGYYFQNKNCIFRYDKQTQGLEMVGNPTEGLILAACVDTTGLLWIADRGGLRTLRIGTGKVNDIPLPDNNDLVTSLAIDRKGTVWMGTPGALYAYIPTEKRFVIFSESDGVLPNDFLPKPVLITQDNNVYMGGATGLVRINQSLNQPSQVTSSLRIGLLDIQLNGTNVLPDRTSRVPSLDLSTGFTSLTIHTKLDETDVFRKRIYRYQIEGLNGDYTESSKPYFMIQTLPPGEYRIKAQCTQSNGLWSPSFTLLELNVLPPWWQSTWFVVLIIGLLLSVAAYALYRREERLQQDLKEKERQIYKEKVQALININHELRTPLTLIYTPLKQLLGSRQIPHELRPKLQRAFKQARQMKNIINMILNMRRMEVGQNMLSLTPASLNAWLQTITDDFRDEFEMRNIQLLFHPDDSIDQVAFDMNQCEIIVNNLLMNAYKFSDPDTTVTVSTQLEPSGRMICVAVRDQGMGLGDENPENLFVRFQQGRHSIQGNGIGLSYAKQLVEMHGGEIHARNNEDRGTTFFFTLPYQQEMTQVQCPARPYLNELLPRHSLAIQNTEPAPAKFRSVLIAEDDPDLCDYLAANLQSVFETIYKASDGMEALPIAVSHLPQLIISDVMMPRMDGLELCRRIKQNAELSYIPVILLASRTDEPSTEDGYKMGADAYVAKPFDMDLLLIQIQNIMNNHNVMRRHYSGAEGGKKTEPATTRNPVDEQFVLQLKRLVEENKANTDLDVIQVAKLMRMSRASLYNKMKATVGVGVNEYITQHRIEYACRLLATTDLSVSEVSEQAGFLHPRNFSTTFKNMTGDSPSEYRKKRRS